MSQPQTERVTPGENGEKGVTAYPHALHSSNESGLQCVCGKRAGYTCRKLCDKQAN